MAEGRVPWGFWPPDTPVSDISAANADAKAGIYIAREKAFVDESDEESDAGAEHEEAAKGASASDESKEDDEDDEDDHDGEEEEQEEEEEEVKGTTGPGMASRFGAFLKIEEGEDDDDSSG